MFHSVLQYSLISWGRASKRLPVFNYIKTLQNRFLRASLFRPSRFSVNALYFELGVLKLHDMFDMEYAKFLFRYSNSMLPNYFNSYFTSLDSIHHHYTRVSKSAFVYCVFSTIFGFEPSPTVLYDRDPDFIIQSVVGLYLD